MRNGFYSAFDRETLAPRGEADHRTPFQVDRDRIIYTHAFRRLQAKTQVFLAGEYDFYRTRLTHSIEVAQIGRAICAHLQHLGDPLSDDFRVDSDLVEAVCLAHDLGHPPFGHAGERALNRLMRPHGGFEGNAQTLRILAETIYSDDGRRRGMKPTRALLDGVLKYPRFWGALPENERENHFLYDDQVDLVRFVMGGGEPRGVGVGRSIECQIMDWADDAAYSLNDIVDGVHAGFLTVGRLEGWGVDRGVSGHAAGLLEELLRAVREGRIDSRFGRKTGLFLKACRMVERPGADGALGNRHRYDLAVVPEIRAEADLYCRIARELVFQSPQLLHLEYKSDYILRRIFELLEERHIRRSEGAVDLLPPALSGRLREEGSEGARARLLCDHLAGMTDGFAIRTYKRLFDPDFGLIGEFA